MRGFDWGAVGVKTGVTADPAAGADPATVTVPAGKRYLLLGAMNIMVAFAAVANRMCHLLVQHDGANVDMNLYQGTAITTGQTISTCLIPGNNQVGYAGFTHILGLPVGGIELAAGATFQVAYDNKNGGDDAGVLRYYYKEAPA